jgi:hypothetical protein
MHDATLTTERVHVVSNARAGIVNFSSAVRLEEVRLECNPIQLNGEDVDGPFSFENRGGNVCSCGEQIDECRVQSAHLEPPGPAD